MTNTQTTASITAKRTWKGTKATITVTYEDGSTDTVGGTRCGRAEAVIVSQWNNDRGPGVYGVRGNAMAASTEAATLASTKPIRHGGATFERTPAQWAVAVLVTDANDRTEQAAAEAAEALPELAEGTRVTVTAGGAKGKTGTVTHDDGATSVAVRLNGSSWDGRWARRSLKVIEALSADEQRSIARLFDEADAERAARFGGAA